MKKIYNTKSKEVIREYLEAHKESRFSAHDIYEHLCVNGSQINITTIYRNLDKLTDSGELLRYKTAEDECCVYQYVEPHAKCHEHLHLQCSSCGKIIHLECGLMSEIKKHLIEHDGFYLECKSSVLKGLCKECKASDLLNSV